MHSKRIVGVWGLENSETTFRCLIHDNDRMFSKAFDTLFETEGLHVIHTPYLAPNANAYAECWVRTVREECLDLILIIECCSSTVRVVRVYRRLLQCGSPSSKN